MELATSLKIERVQDSGMVTVYGRDSAWRSETIEALADGEM